MDSTCSLSHVRSLSPPLPLPLSTPCTSRRSSFLPLVMFSACFYGFCVLRLLTTSCVLSLCNTVQIKVCLFSNHRLLTRFNSIQPAKLRLPILHIISVTLFLFLRRGSETPPLQQTGDVSPECLPFTFTPGSSNLLKLQNLGAKCKRNFCVLYVFGFVRIAFQR